MNRITPLFAALLIVLGAGTARASSDTELRRFALVIGANDGGSERVELRYATTDAQAVARVVQELGGVTPQDLELLLDPRHDDIDAGFAAMKRKLSAARSGRSRLELLVYYSGHSDEEGLLLGGSRYAYHRLREQIRTMPADVHIAILDSCASGAFTRTKGGVRRPAFLVDASSQIRGHAFLSSSSADEAAQESDRIGASFFTHYLVSGLRGGADRNRDGRVTLNEAYQFAFEETVTRTARTRHGTQHPAYDMHLSGTGEVVMTDLRATRAALVLAADLGGRLLIRNREGRLVVELQKQPGAPMTLGLGPERYLVTVRRGTQHFEATVDLTSGGKATLRASQLRAAASEPTVARGVEARSEAPRVPVTVSVAPGFALGGAPAHNRVALNLLVGSGASLDGFELGGLANLRSGSVSGMQIAGVANRSGGRAAGVQIGGVGNWVDDDASAGQIGGVGNWVAGDLGGLQIGGVGSAAGGDARAGQIGGVASWVGGDLVGLQVGGVASVTGGAMRGLQIGGVASAAGSDVRGAQVSGVVNMGRDLHGMQLSVVNIGGDVNGVQLGVVNIARHVRGMQLGVVNVAEEVDGVPIGVVNAIRRGHRAAEVWASDIAPVQVGIKMGGKRVYSLLTAGATDDFGFGGLGLGVHTPMGRAYLDIDMTSHSLWSWTGGAAANDLLVQARTMLGLRLTDHLSVLGGVSMNAIFAFDGPGEDLTLLSGRVYTGDDVVLRLAPSLFAGVALQ